MDPRGPMAAIYAPHLAVAMPGGLKAGANEPVIPKAGRLLMFPSWLLHQCGPIAAPPSASPSPSISPCEDSDCDQRMLATPPQPVGVVKAGYQPSMIPDLLLPIRSGPRHNHNTEPQPS